MSRYHTLSLTCEEHARCGNEYRIRQLDIPNAAAPSFINLEKAARKDGWKCTKTKKGMVHWCPGHATLLERKVKVDDQSLPV